MKWKDVSATARDLTTLTGIQFHAIPSTVMFEERIVWTRGMDPVSDMSMGKLEWLKNDLKIIDYTLEHKLGDLEAVRIIGGDEDRIRQEA